MIKGINAVLISSRDVKRLADFYGDKVGLGLTVNDHGGGMHAEGEVGDTHFAIFPGGPAPQAKGPVTFSLHVDDVQKEYEKLMKRGVAFEGPPHDPGFGGMVANFRDPDGNGVCLMAWKAAQPARG